MSRYSRYTFIFLSAMFVFRLAYNSLPPILPQESYYWKYAKHLALSYHDHPPMAAYTIALFTAIGTDSPFWIRLGCALYTLGLSVLIYRFVLECGEWIRGQASDGDVDGISRTAFLAVVLLNSAVLFSIGATIITPDTPLLFFWTLAIYAVFRASRTRDRWWWYVAGAGLGCAMLSKYTAVFLVFGTILYLAISRDQRFWFRRKEPYLAGALAFVLFSPVIIWNQQHEWSSLLFQSAQRARNWWRFRPQYFGQLIGSQLALVTPVLLFGCLYAVVQMTRRSFGRSWEEGTQEPAGVSRRGRRSKTAGESSGGEVGFPADVYRLLFCYAVPLVGLFTLLSFQTLIKMNWLAPAYVPALIALALLWHERGCNHPERAVGTRRWTLWAIVVAAVISVAAHAMPLVPIFPLKKADTWTGWRELADRVTELKSRMPEGTFIFGTEYKIPSQITYYTPDHLETYMANVFAGNGLQYGVWNDLGEIEGKDAILVVSDADGLKSWEREAIGRVFEEVRFDSDLEVIRRGKVFRRFDIYLCRRYKGLTTVSPPKS